MQNAFAKNKVWQISSTLQQVGGRISGAIFAAGGRRYICRNICCRWLDEYWGQYLQQVGGGLSGAIFAAGGSGNILDNIYSRLVVEYLEKYLQVGGGIFWGIFSAGGWRTCCRWRPLHNWLQPCDRPSSNHSSVCTVRTPQNQALHTYLQNRTNILVISVR